MSLQEVRDAFAAFEVAAPPEKKENLLSVAFDNLVEFLDGDANSQECSICKNIATRVLNELERQGSIYMADNVKSDASEMMRWMRLVEAVVESGYEVPASLKNMYDSISPVSLKALFHPNR